MTIEEAREILEKELLRKERQRARAAFYGRGGGEKRADRILKDPKAFFTRRIDYEREAALHQQLRERGLDPGFDLEDIPKLNEV